MEQYAFLTEDLKHEALESLENTKRQLQQYNYPPAIVSAVELQKRIVSSLPLGMIVPLNQNYNPPYTPEAFSQGTKVSVLGLFPVRTAELRGYNISNTFIDELENSFSKGEKS